MSITNSPERWKNPKLPRLKRIEAVTPHLQRIAKRMATLMFYDSKLHCISYELANDSSETGWDIEVLLVDRNKHKWKTLITAFPYYASLDYEDALTRTPGIALKRAYRPDELLYCSLEHDDQTIQKIIDRLVQETKAEARKIQRLIKH